jgi:CRISPR-associated protein Csb1
MPSLLDHIHDALQRGVAAIRVTSTLQTADGGQKILPPTYADTPHGHNMVTPSGDGVSPWVSVDAPASFANRMEQALVRAELGLDPLRVSIAGKTRSSMQLPHRCFDAVLRDSTLDGQPWRKTDVGKQLIAATPDSAAAFLMYDPAVLLFGAWDSTELGKTGGIGNRWPAVFSGEISATDVLPLRRAGNRIDPLGIEGTEANLVEEADGTLRLANQDGDQDLTPLGDKNKDKYPRRVKPSQANHGNALSLINKGVLVRGEIRMNGALSLSRLRRYRFGMADDSAGHLVIALMGIYGAAAVLEDGLDLRRDCVLVPDDISWQMVSPGRCEPFDCSAAAARDALAIAIEAVPISDPLNLIATETLEHLVTRYR